MTRSNIVNGVLYYIAGKTKDDNPRTLAVPLVSMAMDIVDKYEAPKRATLFPFIHEPEGHSAKTSIRMSKIQA